jgi:hypothetical protein
MLQKVEGHWHKTDEPQPSGFKKITPNGWKNDQRIKTIDRKVIKAKLLVRETGANYLATISRICK